MRNTHSPPAYGHQGNYSEIRRLHLLGAGAANSGRGLASL